MKNPQFKTKGKSKVKVLFVNCARSSELLPQRVHLLKRHVVDNSFPQVLTLTSSACLLPLTSWELFYLSLQYQPAQILSRQRFLGPVLEETFLLFNVKINHLLVQLFLITFLPKLCT